MNINSVRYFKDKGRHTNNQYLLIQFKKFIVFYFLLV